MRMISGVRQGRTSIGNMGVSGCLLFNHHWRVSFKREKEVAARVVRFSHDVIHVMIDVDEMLSKMRKMFNNSLFLMSHMPLTSTGAA